MKYDLLAYLACKPNQVNIAYALVARKERIARLNNPIGLRGFVVDLLPHTDPHPISICFVICADSFALFALLQRKSLTILTHKN